MVKFVQSAIFLAFIGSFISICTSTPVSKTGPKRHVMHLPEEEEPDAGMIQSVQVLRSEEVKEDKVLVEREKIIGWWKKLGKVLKKLQHTVDVKQEIHEMNMKLSKPDSKPPCPQSVSPILIFNLPWSSYKPPQFQPKPSFPKHTYLTFPSSTISSATPKPSPTTSLPPIQPELPNLTAQGNPSRKTPKLIYIWRKPFSFKPKQVVLKYQPTMKRPEPSYDWPRLAVRPTAPAMKKPKFIYIRPKVVALSGNVEPAIVVKKPYNAPFKPSFSWLKPPVASIPQPHPGRGGIYVPQSEARTPRPWIPTEEIRVQPPPTTAEEPITQSSYSGLDKTIPENVMDGIETVIRDTLQAFGNKYNAIQIANAVIVRPRNIQKSLLIQLAAGHCQILMEKKHKVLLDCTNNNKRTLVWIGSGLFETEESLT